MQGLFQLGGLALTIGVTYAPVVVLLGLLNLRERREARLLASVRKALPPRQFRGRLALEARCALLSRRGVVTLDMRGCSRDEIWDAIGRVSRSLPPSVRLVVDGMLDPQLPATLTVEATSALPLRHPSRSSAVPG